jgi:hypothetical protein
MNDTTTFLMEKGCPWVDLRESTGLPDVLWCEKQLCEWIAAPANTWSNLGYVGVAFLFMWMLRKEKSENLRFYWVAAQWVGWTSFIYHASLFYVSQVVDFLGMYVFFFLILTQNAARNGWIKPNRVKRSVWILSIVTTIVSGALSKLGMRLQPVVMGLIVLILVTEYLAAKKATKKINYKFLALSLTSLGIGAAFSASDVTRRFCDPENHWIQGHALWHYFGAIALYFTVHHFRQFYSRDTGDMVV